MRGSVLDAGFANKERRKMEKIRSFEDLTTEQQFLAGGKGGTLSHLHQAGYPVPPGFVILPMAFADDELTSQAWTQVQAQLERLRKSTGAAFAVRSSALSEDSAQASFAGEFETVLEAHTDEAIWQAIHTVRRSRKSERVRAYSEVQGVDTAHDMAVVVQQMIRADISGILFTADPVTGSHTTMAGNFIHGLGDQLVSGKATGEAFTIQRPTGTYEGPIELKRFARKLFKLASRLEKELGGPQDIEWAIAGRKLYLLQARPITTLKGYNPATGEWNDSLTGDYLWSNVNFGEAVSDVMTPLAWTVLQHILGDWIFLPGYQTVGNIGGRPYLNISIFATAFHTIGRSTQDLLKTLEGTLYMDLPERMEIPLIPLPKRSLLSALPHLIRMQLRQRRGVRDLPAYLAENPARCKRMREQIQRVTTKAELLSLWHKEINPHVTQTVWIVLGSAFHSADYTMRVRRDLAKLVGRDDADALISNLSDRSGLLASLGPMVGIAKMARGEMDREVYLEQFGHRGPHEFELSFPRPAEDADWLDRQLAQFRQSPVDVEALLEKRRAEFDAAWRRFQASLPRKVRSMRRRIDAVALRAHMREAARSEYVRDRWMVRAFALRAGELTGLEDDIFFLTLDEVLQVLSGETTATNCIRARRATYNRYRALPPYPSIIRGRFDPFQWAADPKRKSNIFDSHAPLPVVAADGGSSNLIYGSPGAAGRVKGSVRRLDRPEHGDQLRNGEVLVTTQTDIAWTLLFPRAAAIVTDVGAPLSHAAIVARELGIPAVVGCGDATMRLSTGDRVLVDGGQGSVEILDASNDEVQNQVEDD
jgi:phosphohistidine swiveling domain-containing protein